MKLLIDADILVYRMAFRHQKEAFGKLVVDNLEDAVKDLRDFVEDLKVATGATSEVLCLTGSKNFRKELGEYKLARRKVEPPVLLGDLKNSLSYYFEIAQEDVLEADDLLSILMDSNSILASTDKDLNQVPGEHLNWSKNQRYTVSPEDGFKFFLQQVISGDTGDGYSGVPGFGQKKAKRFVEKLWEDLDVAFRDFNTSPTFLAYTLWGEIVKLYESKGLTADDALLNARFAFILDENHWDPKEHKVRLWKPDDLIADIIRLREEITGSYEETQGGLKDD